ncbi:14389_t:CDS:2, partial [Acaulospora colombiana]
HAEAPIILKPADLPQNLASIGAAEVVPDVASESESPELIARGWWLRSDPSTFMQCVAYLRGLVSNQEVPFDGGCAACLLAALLERPQVIPEFTIDGQAPHPPLKFCIAVAGFRPHDEKIDPLLEAGIDTPTVHVLGVNDQIVSLERSQTLVDICRNARVEKHEGGHFIPSKATWRQFFAQYIKADDHSDPSPIASPNPLLTGSGASTPALLSRPPSR